jgi:hypothetical protein
MNGVCQMCLMPSPTVRAASCLLVGLVPGLSLGFLFAPDPTGLAPLAVGAVIAVVVAGYLYQSDWLRDTAQTAS